MHETAPGRERAWNLLKKLGEGDAGEVYLVESLLEKQAAVLKRPRHSAFASDAIRQASQIQREAETLNGLIGLDQPNNRISLPRLLDQSKSGTEFSERFFIVITLATGFDLGLLARTARFGELASPALQADLPTSPSPFQRAFLERLSRHGSIPPLILLRALTAVIDMLESIHSFEISTASQRHHGVIWNDIKPDHIFWDAEQSRFTVIDWGNAQFLEADGATTDRQRSRLNDYAQFINEMGAFLASESPNVYEELSWPTNIAPTSAYSEGIKPLKERIVGYLGEELAELRQVRQKEANLLASAAPSTERFEQLIQIHNRLSSLGETPDYANAEKYFLQLAAELVAGDKLADFRRLCRQIDIIPTQDRGRWRLLDQLAENAAANQAFHHALEAALQENWPAVLWELRLAFPGPQPPPWWESLSGRIRQIQLGIDPETLTPYVTLHRLIHALQAAALQPAAPLYTRFVAETESNASPPLPKHLLLDKLARSLKRDVLPRWGQLEPDPPNAGIEYREIEQYLPEVLELIPTAGQALITALEQPKAQVNIVTDAWQRQDFDTARLGLRHVLLWDPDRGRLLLADHALKMAPTWLEEIRRGPEKDEPLQDYTTRLELTGRDLRNQIASAQWLDSILEALSKLRKGVDPTEVLMEHADLRNTLSWLLEIEIHRPALILPDKPPLLDRQPLPRLEYSLRGVKESALGAETDFALSDSLDTWTPEAQGSSARVFAGFLRDQGGQTHSVAVKLMRPDRAEYAAPLFREEVQILTHLRDVPGVVPLLEFGFMHLNDSQELPPEDRQSSANHLVGEVHRFGLDAIHNFLMDMPTRIDQGWIPYLATQKVDRSENLLLLCDTSYTRGRFLPILEGLRMAIQICDILEASHSRNIVYRDHKILHYYWQETYNGIFAIDWNIARRSPEGLQKADVRFDLVQFSARALHHILTGRSAPGALPLGPTRADEIEAAAQSYSVHWAYDDLRLPKEVKEILERALAGEYNQARQLRQDLFLSFQALSNLIPIS